MSAAAWRRAAQAALLCCLTACATVGGPDAPAEGASISGRLSVRVDATPETPARSVNAGFDLQGTPASGQLNLSSPLGTVLAQARWTPGEAVLTTSDGRKRFAGMDDLTVEMLGERLPVAALFDWLQGRPWTQVPSQATIPPEPEGFRQLGWSVDTSEFAQGWVRAERADAPKVTVRARMERP